MNIKPIETVYNGYRFRSRLEARWAVFFDAAGIKYEYEPEGFELPDGTKYLPDFYLPEQSKFFECKGIMTDKDENKIKQFLKMLSKHYGPSEERDRDEMVIGFPDMSFQTAWWSFDIEYDNKGNPIRYDHENGKVVYCDESWLCRCYNCGKLFFMNSWLGWACRCCGYYNGDSGFEIEAKGYRDRYTATYETYRPFIIARQARFEHGEKPNVRSVSV